MLLLEVFASWREIDIFIAENSSHGAAEVESIDDIENSVDECLQVSYICIKLTFREIYAAE